MASVTIGDRDGFELTLEYLFDDEARRFVKHLDSSFRDRGGFWLNLDETEEGVGAHQLRWLPAQTAVVVASFDDPLTEHHELFKHLNQMVPPKLVQSEADRPV